MGALYYNLYRVSLSVNTTASHITDIEKRSHSLLKKNIHYIQSTDLVRLTVITGALMQWLNAVLPTAIHIYARQEHYPALFNLPKPSRKPFMG